MSPSASPSAWWLLAVALSAGVSALLAVMWTEQRMRERLEERPEDLRDRADRLVERVRELLLEREEMLEAAWWARTWVVYYYVHARVASERFRRRGPRDTFRVHKHEKRAWNRIERLVCEPPLPGSARRG